MRSFLVFAPAVVLSGLLRLFGHVAEPALSSPEIHRVVGEVARVAHPARTEREVKVVTWNIERGLEFDRVLEALRTLDADIYVLQEVDLLCRRSGRRNVAKHLADALDLNWVWAGEFQEIGESFSRVPALTGQAVLSRHPIEDASALRFRAQATFRWRVSPIQPRRGGRIALRVRTAGILIYNAHIESGGDDRLRRRQLDEILADEARSAEPGTPVVIAGDFNNVPVLRSSMFGRLAAAAFEDALSQHEGPRRTATRHHHPIDWIFVKNLQPKDGRVAEIPRASDHFPVMATVVAGP